MTREEIDAAIKRHAETELLYDRPYEDKRKIRVSGRFTVESLSPHRALGLEADLPRTEREASESVEASSYESTILENLRAAGVQNGLKRERLVFDTLEPHAGRYVQAVGTRRDADAGTPQHVAVAIGPEYGTVSPTFIKDAAREALRGQGHDLLLVLGFVFDAQAGEVVGEFRPSEGADFASVAAERQLGRLPILLVRMNPDLAMGDELLKKTGAANLFTVFGEPDIEIEHTPDGLVADIRGIDVTRPPARSARTTRPASLCGWWTRPTTGSRSSSGTATSPGPATTPTRG
ncbi:hypothetical protein [Candidatus Protofrankia californiensis]|uniref:hypothetical protein n=1 Tax=Candidatus Protofrankia californiensis TaxID=1839754 RepID=UPI0019D04B87|nr:hypothetical protein [Candidatus Protofrankia californiensis]